MAEGLNYNATWNAAMLLSQDLQEAVAATLQKRPATFGDEPRRDAVLESGFPVV